MHFQTNLLPSRKTKGWISALSVILIIISYFVVWLLVGEIDLLHLKWFITAYQYKTEDGIMMQRPIYLNLNVLYICLGILGLTILIFCLLKFAFHKVNWDFLPFVVMGNAAGFTWIFSGFIPYNDSNSSWIIIARFIILIVVALVFFFATNAITSKVLLKNNDSSYIFEEIKSEYVELARMKKENEMFTRRKEKEKNYIEVEEEK